jgi:hypothetical protein
MVLTAVLHYTGTHLHTEGCPILDRSDIRWHRRHAARGKCSGVAHIIHTQQGPHEHVEQVGADDHVRYHVQVGLQPGLSVGTTAIACFVPGTGVSKAQAFGWCAVCPCSCCSH